MTWLDSRLEELARQLAFTPARKRREQLACARQLLADIDPEEEYPWEFVVYRITGHRPLAAADDRLAGSVLLADISCLVESISGTLDISVREAPEEVLSLEEVMRRFNVSSKTIQRWRRQGLVAMRYSYPEGPRRLGFLSSDVVRFSRRNREQIDRSARFRQLTAEEKERILRRAARLAVHCRCCLREISRRIARHMNRSPQTILCVIRRHDRSHPESAIFTAPSAPLTAPDRRIIMECFDRGISVDCLARRYCRTRSSIYRVVSQEKAQRVKNLPIRFVTNPLFDLPDAEDVILRVLSEQAARENAVPPPTGANNDIWSRVPANVPLYVAEAFRQPLMPCPLVRDAFRRMNYLKARASRLQAQLDVHGARVEDVAAIEDLLARAGAIRNEILQAHLRVVVHVARRHQHTGENLFELISDGNLWLMRAVENYDFARGVKFTTYLTYVLMKNFARRPGERRNPNGHREARLILAQDSLLDQLGAAEDPNIPDAVDMLMLQGRLADALACLPRRERDLLAAHYGLEAGQGPMSLARIAERMGITKVRVRQIEQRALRRLRRILRVTPEQTALAGAVCGQPRRAGDAAFGGENGRNPAIAAQPPERGLRRSRNESPTDIMFAHQLNDISEIARSENKLSSCSPVVSGPG